MVAYVCTLHVDFEVRVHLFHTIINTYTSAKINSILLTDGINRDAIRSVAFFLIT